MEQEKKSETKEGPNLSANQDLVSHTFDMFLTAKTRIFTLSRYIYDGPASEIDTRLRTLFMEDILSFSISARRLIEMTALKSFSNNKAKIDLQYLDRSQTTEVFLPTQYRISESCKQGDSLQNPNAIFTSPRLWGAWRTL